MTDDRTRTTAPPAGPRRWQLTKNILGGVIGVQSESAETREVSQASLDTYALKVVVGMLVFVLLLALLLW
jgi:hypothetical protein